MCTCTYVRARVWYITLVKTKIRVRAYRDSVCQSILTVPLLYFSRQGNVSIPPNRLKHYLFGFAIRDFHVWICNASIRLHGHWCYPFLSIVFVIYSVKFNSSYNYYFNHELRQIGIIENKRKKHTKLAIFPQINNGSYSAYLGLQTFTDFCSHTRTIRVKKRILSSRANYRMSGSVCEVRCKPFERCSCKRSNNIKTTILSELLLVLPF